MKNSFTKVQSNKFSRNFGGTTKGVADPYVTGYHHIYFTSIPAGISKFMTGSSGSMAPGSIKDLLAGSCLSVTPPGGTLNRVEFTGLGGTKWAVPGNIDYGNTVSVKFLEFNGTPIADIFHAWIKLIRDYRTGVTDLAEQSNLTGYTKSTYAGLMYYWTTAPDGKTVEYYAAYDGVFPTKDPQDLFSSDVETVGRMDIEIEFSLDYIWHEPWVRNKCQTLSDGLMSQKTDIQNRSDIT